MKNRISLFLLLWTTCLFTYAQTDHFLIGIWSFSHDNAASGYHAGINTTIGNSTEFYQLFKECGFNTVQIEYQLMPHYNNMQHASSNPSKDFLDRADSLGMKIILDCPDLYVDRRIDTMYELVSGFTQYNPTNSSNGLNYYGNHPAIAGFAVCDEPTTVVFPDIASFFSDIENYDHNMLRLVNLLPSYGKDTAFGYPGVGFADAYPQYVEHFIETTHPNILSFDAYPIHFFNACDSCTFYNLVWPNSFYFNFDVVARVAENHHIPFVYIPTFLSVRNYDTLKNVSEMRYVVYAGLMHGARGLNYWHSGANYHMWDLLRIETKEFLRYIHHKIQSHEDLLLSLHYKASYHVDCISTIYPSATNGEYIPVHMQWTAFGNDTFTQAIFSPINPIEAVSGFSMDSLAISYLFDDSGGKYFWVDNKSFKTPLQIQLNLNNSCSVVDVMNDQRCPQSGNVGVQLLPGEAKLFRAFFTNDADTVLSSVTWSQKRVQGQSLVVDSLTVLTIKDTLFMAGNARLIVRPGGKLIVDGGTLTSACAGEMWQGIEVVGDRTKSQTAANQGVVELKNGAVIENAWCGIRTGLREDTVTFATTGGIITADSAVFKNNRHSVVINSYAHTTPSGNISTYSASFTRCSFTIDANNLFASNNTAFAEHVRLWDVKWIPFKGCVFENRATDLLFNGRGIYAEDAGLLINTYCAVNYQADCKCPATYADSCTFYGFATAVEVNTSGNPYAVTVNQAQFSGNGTGVRINGNNFATVTRCTFDQTTWPESVRDNYGLYLNGCTGYKVEENTFMRTTYPTGPLTVDNSTGICVKTSGITNNSLYRNNYEKLTKGIHVVGQNGHGSMGLCMTCNHFSQGKYDIYIASKAVVADKQGSSSKGADNTFAFTQNSSFYNLGWDTITYFYKNYSDPIFPYRIIPSTKTAANNCPSTLCNGGGGVYMPLAGFSSQIETHATAAGDATTEGTDVATQQQFLSETYYTAVRTLMSDSLLDLSALEQWHTAAQPIADPYSLTETRFCEGYNESFLTDADNAELTNYAELHAMKLALRDNDGAAVGANNHSPLQPGGHVNWYALTPAQTAKLQTIAERNTGRASVMAKGVLCFFFGICYDDEDVAFETDPSAETRAKHTATDIADDAALTVYPNPTDDLLFVELHGAGIANVALYDLQGRTMMGAYDTPQLTNTTTLNVKSLPAGVYVLHVKDADGREYQQKVVRK